MANPYVGEIRMFAGNFAPVGWAFCDGSTLPISQYAVLFQLLGTAYGGDGVTTFNLPDLRSRVPVHMGQGPGLGNYGLGGKGGAESVALGTPNIAAHNHQASGSSTPANSINSAGNVWADSSHIEQFSAGNTANSTMGAGLSTDPGGGQPHDNMLPFQAINFIIAFEGIYPSQN